MSSVHLFTLRPCLSQFSVPEYFVAQKENFVADVGLNRYVTFLKLYLVHFFFVGGEIQSLLFLCVLLDQIPKSLVL